MTGTQPLSITEATERFKDNPEAAGMAVGMILLQSSHEESNRLNRLLDTSQEKIIASLQKQLDYWQPLGRRWLALKDLLRDEEIYE